MRRSSLPHSTQGTVGGPRGDPRDQRWRTVRAGAVSSLIEPSTRPDDLSGPRLDRSSRIRAPLGPRTCVEAAIPEAGMLEGQQVVASGDA